MVRRDQDAVDRNNELISAVNAQMVLLWEAERTAANKIRALYGAEPLHSVPVRRRSERIRSRRDPRGHGDAGGCGGGALRGCGEATVNFVFRDFLWGRHRRRRHLGHDRGSGHARAGYNPATGDWFSGDAYGARRGATSDCSRRDSLSARPPGPQRRPRGGRRRRGARRRLLPTRSGRLHRQGRRGAPEHRQGDHRAGTSGRTTRAPRSARPSSTSATSSSRPERPRRASRQRAPPPASSSKMARVADLIDPGAWAVNGALKVGGLGLGGPEERHRQPRPSARSTTSPWAASTCTAERDVTSALDAMIRRRHPARPDHRARGRRHPRARGAGSAASSSPRGRFDLPGSGRRPRGHGAGARTRARHGRRRNGAPCRSSTSVVDEGARAHRDRRPGRDDGRAAIPRRRADRGTHTDATGHGGGDGSGRHGGFGDGGEPTPEARMERRARVTISGRTRPAARRHERHVARPRVLDDGRRRSCGDVRASSSSDRAACRTVFWPTTGSPAPSSST